MICAPAATQHTLHEQQAGVGHLLHAARLLGCRGVLEHTYSQLESQHGRLLMAGMVQAHTCEKGGSLGRVSWVRAMRRAAAGSTTQTHGVGPNQSCHRFDGEGEEVPCLFKVGHGSCTWQGKHRALAVQQVHPCAALALPPLAQPPTLPTTTTTTCLEHGPIVLGACIHEVRGVTEDELWQVAHLHLFGVDVVLAQAEPAPSRHAAQRLGQGQDVARACA